MNKKQVVLRIIIERGKISGKRLNKKEEQEKYRSGKKQEKGGVIWEIEVKNVEEEKQ